jgi:hypothetical protein
LGSRLFDGHCIDDSGRRFRVLDLAALAIEPAGRPPTQQERESVTNPPLFRLPPEWRTDGQVTNEQLVDRQARRAAEALARAERDDVAEAA